MVQPIAIAYHRDRGRRSGHGKTPTHPLAAYFHNRRAPVPSQDRMLFIWKMCYAVGAHWSSGPMFDLKRFFGIGKPAPPGENARTGNSSLLTGDSIRLVAIMEQAEDGVALRDIAESFNWNLSVVDSSASAIALLRPPPPLVICDRDLTGEDWRAVLAAIAALPQAVCVLLASRVVDEYLCTEVNKHHGYDVVSKPFQREELRRAVTFAWSWRGWTSWHLSDSRRNASS